MLSIPRRNLRNKMLKIIQNKNTESKIVVPVSFAPPERCEQSYKQSCKQRKSCS